MPKKWLEPFRVSTELQARDYETAFSPRLPRRTAVNRLNRLRDAGWVVRHGETRATIYCLTEQVAAIVRAGCGRKEAVARLRRWAEESVIESDRNRFVASSEETLTGIHEGNFARYRIRPSEFMSSEAAWTAVGNTKA